MTFEMLTVVFGQSDDDPDLLKKVANHGCTAMTLKPKPEKSHQVRSNVKVLLTVFFDCNSVVHHEFLPHGRIVNKEYYFEIMR